MSTFRSPRQPLLQRADEAADDLLRRGLAEAEKAKARLRDSLSALAWRTRMPTPSGSARQPPLATGAPVLGTPGENPFSEPTCQVTFDANLRLTTMVGRANIALPFETLRLLIDPRSWSTSGGVIAAAFLVKDVHGTYTPMTLSRVPLGYSWDENLGKGWNTDPKRAPLLYEYARSEIASFENILAIDEFSASEEGIQVKYRLHECLVCTVGIFSMPGGLTVNQGHVTAQPLGKDSWRVEVLKEIQVRDLTPHDSGNRYDFGQSVNSTMGAALSEWVHDTSILRPVF